MANSGIDFFEFNRRLWLMGGRDQIPDGSLRRASGIAPEQTRSIVSAYPYSPLYSIKALNLVRFANARWQFDGATLYREGLGVYGGFNGSRAALVTMPPASGLQDYLFVGGAGQMKKVDANNNVTNWGIDKPADQMQATNETMDELVIDTFDSTGGWNAQNCSISVDSSDFVVGTGSLQLVEGIVPPITITKSISIDLNHYANGDISFPSDMIAFWFNVANAAATEYVWLEFDVGDGTFLHDYYKLVVQLVQQTSNPFAAGASLLIAPQSDSWVRIGAPKSQFTRVGQNLNLDWGKVNKVRFRVGLPLAPAQSNTFHFDDLRMFGGAGLGVGPAALTGGSEYDYYVTFMNSTTGNESNPQPDAAKIFSVAENKVDLAQIPTSSDPQVDARNLYRSKAGGGIAFYLDTIGDNTTTTYVDETADSFLPITLTPRLSQKAYIADQLIDGGNGFYFKAENSGTTGATVPVWSVPTSEWSPVSSFLLNETISPLRFNGICFEVTTAGNSGLVEPFWGTVVIGGTITDGSVVWTRIANLTTVDGGVTWDFQGINSLPTLGTKEVRFDNIIPSKTWGDAIGPYQGSMVWTRDSSAGNQGKIYISPPGRAEGWGQFIDISTQNDPCQKAVIWQEQLWVFTSNAIYRIDGTYPAFSATKLYDFSGTIYPFTIVSDKRGVFYRDSDGTHVFDYASNPLVGFEPIAPLLRNQGVENLPAFNPTYAAFAREEVYFSNETNLTMIMSIDPQLGGPPVWRVFNGLGFTALNYEEETGEVVASFNSIVALWEISTPTFYSQAAAAAAGSASAVGYTPFAVGNAAGTVSVAGIAPTVGVGAATGTATGAAIAPFGNASATGTATVVAVPAVVGTATGTATVKAVS